MMGLHLEENVSNLLEIIVKSIVGDDNPVLIKVHQPTDSILVAEIFVPKKTMGLIIGRHGKTIESIRIILRSSLKQEIAHSFVEVRAIEEDTL